MMIRKSILVTTVVSLLCVLSFTLCLDLHTKQQQHGHDTSTVLLKKGLVRDYDVITAQRQDLHQMKNNNRGIWSLHHSKFFSTTQTQAQTSQANTDQLTQHSFLIKFNPQNAQLTTEFKNEFLAKYGVTLSHYIPHYTYLVQATEAQAQKILAEDSTKRHVLFMMDYEPRHKTSHDLDSEESLEWALKNRIAAKRAQQEVESEQKDILLGQNSKKTKKQQRQQQEHEMTAEQIHEKKMRELAQEKERVAIALHIFKSTNSDVDSVLRDMRRALEKHGVEYHVLMKASSEKIVMSLPFHSVIRAVEILSHHSAVHWIDLLNFASYGDNKTNRWVVQTNTVSKSPYTTAGITGKNQVIGYGDSGLDVFNCFFYDDKHEVPFTNATVPFAETNHRKIAGYLAYMDHMDDPHGHGTHVGGTLAGASLKADSPTAAYNGIANDAKIAFMDIGCSQDGGCQCTGLTGCPCDLMADKTCPSGSELFMPLDLNEGYFPFSYERGARIHSNSIGGVIGDGYGIESREIDTFMYEHDDFLIVWSAGNSGRNDGLMTLTGPLKQAKNSLIVAAGTSAYEGWQDVMNNFRDYNEKAKQYQQPLWQKNFCECNTTCKKDICESIEDLGTEEGCCRYFKDCEIPMPDDATNPLASVNNMCCKKCAVQSLEKPSVAKFYQIDNIASFSSLGPAIDGRIKPEITAPGFYVLSAKSHGSDPSSKCSANNQDDLTYQVQPMAGTSMATPTVGSTAALVRDYFESGFYPSGERNTENIVRPSAALVKAVLIDSAKPMTGVARWRVEEDKLRLIHFADLQPTHRRYFEGFGLLNLANTLYLKDVTTNKLYVRDRVAISTGLVHSYEFETGAVEDGELTVTLVWTDYPSSPASSIALVNDLDLEVAYDDVKLLGNSLDESTSMNPDRLNNVEKVAIASIRAGAKVRVTVRGYHIPNGPQKYALVISGPAVQHDKVSFKETSSDGPLSPYRQITMPVSLFAFIVGAEGAVIALLVISLGVALLKLSKRNNSYSTIQ